MKYLIITIKLLLILILITLISAFFYYYHLKPTYKGNLKIANLKEPTDVYFDDIGVPHIYAENQEDAYRVLGYLHAQDRLWQMELMRRIGAGRLSEIFGKDLIETDKFFLTMGIDSKAKETINKLDKNTPSYILSQAYLDGINQFIDYGPTPIEYTLVGVQREHFTLKDIYNVYGYMSFSFAMAHKTDPFISQLEQKLGKAYIDELVLNSTDTTTMIPIFNLESKQQTNFITKLDYMMDKLPVPPFIGSNSWVIGSEKTANSKVIFCNDPHINYSQPAVWYQSHIVCPDYEMYNFNLALTPFPLLAHNRQYAYGLTMFENDDIDFYAEKISKNNPQQYMVGDELKNFIIEEKTIKVKGEDPIVFKVKSSIHGPIMNEFIGFEESKNPIAMDWIYTKFNNEMLVMNYQLSHAKSLSDFKVAVSKLVAPGLNIMYGDAQNNIAWFAGGKLYRHQKKVNTKHILDGANGLDDKLNYIDFKDNPKSINPTWNYVYSANNQPNRIMDSLLYPGYYLPEDRAKRITDKLTNQTHISIKEMKSLMTDVTSSKVPDLIKNITVSIAEEKLTKKELIAFKILRSWKGNFDLNEVAPTIYIKFKYLFLKNVFKDELGTQGFNKLMETHLVKKQFNKQLQKDFSVWNDDISTDIIENKQQIITKSFKEAVSQLESQLGNMISQWTWNKVHTVEHEHTIGSKVALLRKYFNVGPFPINGTNEVLNNQIFKLNEEGVYKVTGGPSSRRIIDFSDIENSIAIIPTGQSGNVFSKHYKDQAQKFVHGEFVKMLLNKDSIQKSKDKLVLIPK